ncbi:hypothetical protein H4R33_007203, partial [Dimargaris cristalligena]
DPFTPTPTVVAISLILALPPTTLNMASRSFITTFAYVLTVVIATTVVQAQPIQNGLPDLVKRQLEGGSGNEMN